MCDALLPVNPEGTKAQNVTSRFVPSCPLWLKNEDITLRAFVSLVVKKEDITLRAFVPLWLKKRGHHA